jgi:peptidyl-prolyl cis-trans isomerase SurA
MVPEFIDITRTLQDSGAVSQPFMTPFGWHIIKLVGRKPVGSFEAEQPELKTRLEKDVRNKLSEKAVLDKIKGEYGFKENLKNRDAVFATLDSTALKGEWSAEKAAGLDKVVFTLGDKKYTQHDFAAYMAEKQTKRGIADLRTFFDDTYKSYVTESCIAYEDKKLEEKYPDFRMLVQEYHDGILLFDLTDRNVWSKAVKDTSGLRVYFNEHPGKYMWGERLHATLVTVLQPASVDTDALRKMFTDGKTTEEILAAYNPDTTLSILAETAKFSPDDALLADKIQWKTGLSQMIDTPEGPGFAYVYAVLAPEPKSLEEARGLATADYQNYLEEQWIKDLRAKYPVIIHEGVLQSLK